MHGFQNFFLRQNKLVLEVHVFKNFLKCCHAGQDVDCIKKTHTHCLPSHSCEVGPVCPPASVKPHACFARMLGSLENKKQRLSESTLWKRSFFLVMSSLAKNLAWKLPVPKSVLVFSNHTPGAFSPLS